MRVGLEDGLRSIADPGRDDVNRDATRECVRRMGVTEDVKRSGRDAGGLAVTQERFGQRVGLRAEGSTPSSAGCCRRLLVARDLNARAPEDAQPLENACRG